MTKPINFLITGGTGFLGKYLTKSLLDKYPNSLVRTITRNEKEIQDARAFCNSERLETLVIDIRDVCALEDVVSGIDCVFHLAAMKHIDLCELNPIEAVTTNVVGTLNLLNLFKGHTFIGMSTDKAAEPNGCYGATKLLLERMVISKAKYYPEKRYMVVRSGNIFGSSGSVIDKWRQQISERNEITITDPKMTRFFIQVNELVDFLVDLISHGETGRKYIPFQRALVIGDLAQAIIRKYGNNATKIKIIGLRQSEKKHELLFGEYENVDSTNSEGSSLMAQKMTQKEIETIFLHNN